MDEEKPISIHTVCRTCLSNLQYSNNFFNLFLVPGLSKMLCVCTSLEVDKQDGFPINLCGDCFNKVNDFHAFQKQCVDSLAKFKDILSSSSSISHFTMVNEAEDPDLPNLSLENDEDHINFDPLLSAKIEIVDNEQDVLKMIEDVDKDVEDQPIEELIDSEDDYNAAEELDNSDSDDSIPLSCLKSIPKSTKPKSRAKRKPAQDEASDTDVDDAQNPRENPSTKYECTICGKKFLKISRFDDHMKHHNDELPFQCPVESCKKGFMTIVGRKHHIDHNHEELVKVFYPCTVEGCDQTFPRDRMLKYHLKKIHQIVVPATRSFPCTECDKVYRCRVALKKHMYKHTGEQLPHHCDICDKRFAIKTDLKDHLMRHAGIKNHVCPHCGVGKINRQELNKHILTHTREKQFKCPHCDHASHNKQALTNHINGMHNLGRKYSCQYCGQTFNRANIWKIHEKRHTGEDCPECKICGKKFLYETYLTKHLQLHQISRATAEPKSGENKSNRVEVVDISQLAGTIINPITSVTMPAPTLEDNLIIKRERKFVCPVCKKGFFHLSNMKIHLKVLHEKVKDYACRFCNKLFGRSEKVKEHEKVHTGERPYKCDICGKAFTQSSSCRRHRLIHDKPPRLPLEAAKPRKPRKPRPKKSDNPDRIVQKRPPRIDMNKEPTMNYAQYQDPVAEREAATAELAAQKLIESETKLKASEKTRAIREAASKLLEKYEQQQAIEKIQQKYVV